MKKSKIKTVFSLFFYFFRISWFTFGGGWSIVAQMQKDYVDQQKVLTSEELLDIVSVGRSVPGTMIGNVAYLFGYHQAGVLGGLAALTGMVTPPMLILSVLTLGYSKFKDNVYVAKMLTGVRAAVVPILLSAILKLSKGNLKGILAISVCLGACVLSLVFHVNCVPIILAGGAIGLIAGHRKEEAK